MILGSVSHLDRGSGLGTLLAGGAGTGAEEDQSELAHPVGLSTEN